MMSQIQYLSNEKFERTAYLPAHTKRSGEGGMRLQESCNQSANKSPLITVITVVFNSAVTLEKSILSVIKQTCDDMEYLVIDGGSNDGTIDILRKYEYAIDYWVSEPDAGIYDAFNKAVRCSRGDWIYFLGADDYFYDESVLSAIAPYLSANSSFKLIYGSVAIVNSQTQELFRVGEPWKIAKKRFGSIVSIPHQGLMHHRTWFEKYGLFDTSYRMAGDYEMLLRGWPNEEALFIKDRVIACMRQGGVTSTPETTTEALREIRRAQRVHGSKLPSVRLLAAFTTVFIRKAFTKIFGVHTAFQLMDFGRKLFGKPPYWTKI